MSIKIGNTKFAYNKITWVVMLLFISQDLQHALWGLLFCINPFYQLAVFISFYNYMFRRRNKTMFDASITAYLILVSSRMKETNIKWLFIAFQLFFIGSFYLSHLLMGSIRNFSPIPQVSGSVVIKEESIMYQVSRSFWIFSPITL